MDVNTINKKRMVGDFAVVARMTGRTIEACRVAWRRGSGKPFEDTKKALEAVIASREKLLSNKN